MSRIKEILEGASTLLTIIFLSLIIMVGVITGVIVSYKTLENLIQSFGV